MVAGVISVGGGGGQERRAAAAAGGDWRSPARSSQLPLSLLTVHPHRHAKQAAGPPAERLCARKVVQCWETVQRCHHGATACCGLLGPPRK